LFHADRNLPRVGPTVRSHVSTCDDVGVGSPHLVLASRSETRLRVLRQAGFDPIVAPADVDETLASSDIAVAVTDLAWRKAKAVAPRFVDDVVLGCDSLVVLDDDVLGKPEGPAQAGAWWRSMRGRSVTVWTGHALVLGEQTVTGARSADVHFEHVTDADVDAYVATGEALGAAGAFRLDGRAGLFVESITGEPGTVHGVSLSFLATALEELGVGVRSLWV
jgi:septum formation protein